MGQKGETKDCIIQDKQIECIEEEKRERKKKKKKKRGTKLVWTKY